MDYRQNPHVKIIKQCAAAVAEGLDPEVVQFNSTREAAKQWREFFLSQSRAK